MADAGIRTKNTLAVSPATLLRCLVSNSLSLVDVALSVRTSSVQERFSYSLLDTDIGVIFEGGLAQAASVTAIKGIEKIVVNFIVFSLSFGGSSCG